MPRQFDIVENLNARGREKYPFLLVLQHDRIGSLPSVVVAPLVAFDHAGAATRLHPSLTVLDKQYLILIEELAAAPRRSLGPVVGSAEAQRYEIVAALDLLFTGV